MKLKYNFFETSCGKIFNVKLVVFVLFSLVSMNAVMIDGGSNLNHEIYTDTKISGAIDNQDFCVFSTFLGGTADEKGVSYNFYDIAAIATDSEQNFIVLGRTCSQDFPVKNAFQDKLKGKFDITISKFSFSGELIFSTFFGGSGNENANGLAIDSDDNIIFGGITNSQDLPVKDAYRSTPVNLGDDAYFVKLSSDGQTLLYSTYFGGAGGDFLYTLAVDSKGRVGITGTTSSSDLPVKNAFQENKSTGINYDPYVAVFEPDGQSLSFCTYIGADKDEQAWGLAFDSNDYLVLGGYIERFDSIGNVFQETRGGSKDTFIAKFDLKGNIKYLSFLGGAGDDIIKKLIVDKEDNIYVTGTTTSRDFPTVNAFQNISHGYTDAYLAKISSNGKKLFFSTYFGGNRTDESLSIGLSPDGDPIITGLTSSMDLNTTILYDGFYDSKGSQDAFVTKFSRYSGEVIYSTKFGGSKDELALGVVQTQNNSLMIMGYTFSDDFPVENAYEDTFQGGVTDIFVTHIKIEGEKVVVEPKSISGFNLILSISCIALSSIVLVIKMKKVKI